MIVAGQTLALEVSAGAGGFGVVVLLGLALAGLIVMMSRSLVRMRDNVASGRFGARTGARNEPSDSDSGEVRADIPSQGRSERN